MQALTETLCSLTSFMTLKKLFNITVLLEDTLGIWCCEGAFGYRAKCSLEVLIKNFDLGDWSSSLALDTLKLPLNSFFIVLREWIIIPVFSFRFAKSLFPI